MRPITGEKPLHGSGYLEQSVRLYFPEPRTLRHKARCRDDGSDESEAALAHTTNVADWDNGPITDVHPVDPDIYEERESEPIEVIVDAQRRLIVQSVADAEERGIDSLAEAAELAAELGHPIEWKLLYDDPVREITDYAADGGFDGIFIGHRGLSNRVERVVGSVATGVVERASVPVTIVR